MIKNVQLFKQTYQTNNLSNAQNFQNQSKQIPNIQLQRIPVTDYISFGAKLNTANTIIKNLNLTGDLKKLVQDFQGNENMNIILEQVNNNNSRKGNKGNVLLLSAINELVKEYKLIITNYSEALVSTVVNPSVKQGAIKKIMQQSYSASGIKPVDIWLQTKLGINEPVKLSSKKKLEKIREYLGSPSGNPTVLIHDLKNICYNHLLNSAEINENLNNIAQSKSKSSDESLLNLCEKLKDNKYFQEMSQISSNNTSAGKKVNNMLIGTINEIVNSHKRDAENFFTQYVRALKYQDGASKYMKDSIPIQGFGKIKPVDNWFRENLNLNPDEMTNRKQLYTFRKQTRNNAKKAVDDFTNHYNESIIIPSFVNHHLENILKNLPAQVRKN
ncbi:MAG: hypothetical protein PHC34_05465 [Candidatus Gastranaerophilales bacterium]|nr:hypothetical protein [Candidatus Gastranaerophilales bacterium]